MEKVVGKPGVSRSSCDACRKAKTQCTKNEVELMDSCLRCLKNNRVCTVQDVPWKEYWSTNREVKPRPRKHHSPDPEGVQMMGGQRQSIPELYQHGLAKPMFEYFSDTHTPDRSSRHASHSPLLPQMDKLKLDSKSSITSGLEMDRMSLNKISTSIAQVSECISLMDLDPDTIHWLVTQYYYRGLHYVINLIAPDLTSSQNAPKWLGRPLLTGALICTSFHRYSGELVTSGPNRLITVNPAKLERLFHSVLTASTLIVDLACKDEPSQTPLISLALLMEAMVSIEVVHLFWGRTAYMPEFWRINLMSCHLANRWQLCQMDLYDPKHCQLSPPNAYLRHIWDPHCPDSPFTGPLPAWRQVLRRLIWNFPVIDGIYSGYMDVYPRIGAQDVCLLRPPIPDSVFSVGWEEFAKTRYQRAQLLQDSVEDPDRWWDDWYKTSDGHYIRDMQWTMLERGHPTRELALTVMMTNIRKNEVALLHAFTCVLSAGILGTINPSPSDPTVGFYPFLLFPQNFVKPCQQLVQYPRRFYQDLVQDALDHLPDPLNPLYLRDSEDMWQLISQWWDMRIATRFVIYMTRLMDYKLRLSAWTPQFSLVRALVAMQDGVEKKARDTVGYPTNTTHQRYPPHHVPAGSELGSGWLRLYPDTTLEEVLADSITISQMLRRVNDAKSQDGDSVRIGHSILSVAIRVALIHVSIVMALRQRQALGQFMSQSELSLLESSEQDARIHMSFVKHILDFTGDQNMPRWLTLLDQWLQNDHGLADRDIQEIISALVEDFR